jgi:hypothetical protein
METAAVVLVFVRPFSPLLEAARVMPLHLGIDTSLDACCRSSTAIFLQQTSTSSRPLHLKQGVRMISLSFFWFKCVMEESKEVLWKIRPKS